jgi:hypothetical protein
MTHGVLRGSAVALGLAAFVSSSPLSTARADTSAASGTTSATSGAASAPSRPASTTNRAAPTPSGATAGTSGAASAPSGATAVQHPAHAYVRHYAHRYARHYVWRNGHRYVYYRHNPVAVAATGVAGGIADLGSLAAYPFYCFPNYGSCRPYLPY